MALVKALVAIKYKGAWHNPATPSSVFEMDDDLAKTMASKNQIAFVAELEEVQTNLAKDEEDAAILAAQIEELTQIKGVDEDIAKAFIKLGFDSIEKLQQAEIEKIQRVKGVGKAKAKDIIDDANEFEIQ